VAPGAARRRDACRRGSADLPVRFHKTVNLHHLPAESLSLVNLLTECWRSQLRYLQKSPENIDSYAIIFPKRVECATRRWRFRDRNGVRAGAAEGGLHDSDDEDRCPWREHLPAVGRACRRGPCGLGGVPGEICGLRRRPRRLLGRRGQADRLDQALHQGQEHLLRARPDLDQVVRGRHAQRLGQLRRPPPRHPRRPDRDHLGAGRSEGPRPSTSPIASCIARSARWPTSSRASASGRATGS
jgi:hypothetical protein